ncbi:hypothetical protein GCM10017691_46830 [Pseudonocardia petroleophila]
MSTPGYDEGLASERAYVAGLHVRLDAERARVQAEHDAALRSHDGTAVERDVEVRAAAKQVKRLHVADEGLCFGRMDALSGDRSYIGRIGLFDADDDYAPLLLDWRAPAARAFYTAAGAHPEGMRRRRQFHSRGRRVVEFTDEVLGRPDGDTRGDAALLAAVDAPRGEGMRDIVATIQAEQDEIIRLDHPGVLVIEGGPGTGKTVVALHRVAYLLYTQRERIERNGVLVVGPNPAFLTHISRVLPSLGESDVVFLTTGDLVPGRHVTVGGRGHLVGSGAGRVRARPLGPPVADGQLPHPRGDHGRRRCGARRVRPRRPAAGVRAGVRGAAVVATGHRRRAARRRRGVRAR